MPRIVSLKQIKVLKTISWWDISEELSQVISRRIVLEAMKAH